MRSTLFQVTPRDQLRFAKLSGDFNPIHLDALVARRTGAGSPIVHGLHLLLRALDVVASRRHGRPRPLAVTATFLQPALVGERLLVASVDDRLAITDAGGAELAILTVQDDASGPPDSLPALGRPRQPRGRAVPRVLSAIDVETAQGTTAVRADAAAARMFPEATRRFGARAVCALATVSGIVGMECPGRDSLLSSVRVRFSPGVSPRALAWRVHHVDRRFGLVRMSAVGEGIAADVAAFVRRGPVPPPSIAIAAQRVGPSEFSDQRALIVGGSRGLGAATAVIIAAGGGTPLITYATGKLDALALRAGARGASRTIHVAPFDVEHADPSALASVARRRRITHLYYFATPRIFTRRHDPFDAALFDRFASFYVTRFAAACAAIRGSVEPLTIFYPSSTAIDEAPAELTEYAAAKSAGESLCRVLMQRDPKLHIDVRRLPRVNTDQTVSALGVPAADPLDVMLPIVRDLQRSVR